MLIEDCQRVSITEWIQSSIVEACCGFASFWGEMRGKKAFEKWLPLFLFSFGHIVLIYSTSVLYVGMSLSRFLQ